MGGAALIAAVKYVCVWEEKGEGGVCVGVTVCVIVCVIAWVRKGVCSGVALIAAVKYV